MAESVFSVSQISDYLEKKLLLDPMLIGVRVRGEITNFSLSSKGQAYFSIKDDLASLGCIIFDTSILEDSIENGSMVVVSGEIGFYKRFGKINLIVKSISLEGKGDLYEQFLMTKAKLEDEGLFDTSRKKQIPRFPFNIGVITSAAGAAMHDIVNVAQRRFSGISIKVYSAVVQGNDAPKSLIDGIEYFNKNSDVDLIIIGRGGGSFEDLFSFNDEALARKIYDSDIPIVSAVGHEIDYTISDFAADLRAPTPSAAAEICIPMLDDIKGNIAYYKERFGDILSRKVLTQESYLIEKRLLFERFSPSERITEKRSKLDLIIKTLKDNMTFAFENEKAKILNHKEKLIALSPSNVLSRGFSYITDFDGKAINSAKKLDLDKKFIATFADGSVSAKVIKPKEEE